MSKNTKIYLDFDGCIVNTIKRIVDMYNEDFKYYENFTKISWTDIDTWQFNECKCANHSQLNTYFNTPRFFNGLEFMDNAKEVLDRISNSYEIIIVSMGRTPNLKCKEIWIKDNLPYAKFIPINFNEHIDKHHIDMSDGILMLDDKSSNLNTNAKNLAVFGDEYSWNNHWEGVRLHNWYEVERFIPHLEQKSALKER